MNAWVISIHRYIDEEKNETKLERYLVHATTEEQAKAWFKSEKYASNKSQDWYFASVVQFNLDMIIKLS